jgi:hypothetical protein
MLRLKIFKRLLRRLHYLGPRGHLCRSEPSSLSPCGGGGTTRGVGEANGDSTGGGGAAAHSARRPGRCGGTEARPVHGGVPRDAGEVQGGADEAAAGGDGVHAKGGVTAQLSFHLRKVTAQHPFI